MCSACQQEEKNRETNLKTEPQQCKGLSFAFWHHAANGASTQPRRVKLPKMSSLNLGTEVFGFTTLGDLEPFQSAPLSRFLTMMKGIRCKTSPTETFQMQKRKNAQTLGLKSQPFMIQGCVSQLISHARLRCRHGQANQKVRQPPQLGAACAQLQQLHKMLPRKSPTYFSTSYTVRILSTPFMRHIFPSGTHVAHTISLKSPP